MVTDYNILRSRLEREKKRLTDALDQVKAISGPGAERREGSPFGKREEEATQSFELEKRLAAERQLKENLVEVGRALDKFSQGTYGFCDGCAKPIDPARLEALPHANLCVACKSSHKNNIR